MNLKKVLSFSLLATIIGTSTIPFSSNIKAANLPQTNINSPQSSYHIIVTTQLYELTASQYIIRNGSLPDLNTKYMAMTVQTMFKTLGLYTDDNYTPNGYWNLDDSLALSKFQSSTAFNYMPTYIFAALPNNGLDRLTWGKIIYILQIMY